MIYSGIFLVLFGILLIIFPELVSYLLGGLLISIGLNMMLFFWVFKNQPEQKTKWFFWIGK